MATLLAGDVGVTRRTACGVRGLYTVLDLSAHASVKPYLGRERRFSILGGRRHVSLHGVASETTSYGFTEMGPAFPGASSCLKHPDVSQV